MADTHESRAELKSRLKNSVISKNDDIREGGDRPSLLVYILIVVCFAALMYGAYYFMNFSVSNEYSIVWERKEEQTDGEIDTFKGYVPFNGGLIKYTKDGAELIDKNGNAVWDRSYQMNAPIIDVSKNYAVIADQGATDIYIFDGTTLTGASETVLPISLVRVADNGVVYAVLNDSDAEYITAFNPDGSPIDLSVKSILTGDGYPFDIDVSPDGTELITSYVGMESGQIVNNVVFRNFGSVGQNTDARRVVGGFKDEFAGHIAGKVYFSTNEYSQAFYDGGVVFFSTEVLNSPEVLAHVTFEEKMMAVGSAETFSAVLLENTGYDEHAEVIDSAGAAAKDKTEAEGKASDDAESESAGAETTGSDDSESSDSNAEAADEAAVNDGGDTASDVTGTTDDGKNRYEVEASDGEGKYKLITFNNRGSKTGEADVDIEYKSMSVCGDVAVVYDSHEIRVYSGKGNLRGTFEFEEGSITSVSPSGKNGELYIVSGNTIYRIRY